MTTKTDAHIRRTWTTTDWLEWLPKATNADWIQWHLRRETRKRLKAAMKKRIAELEAGHGR